MKLRIIITFFSLFLISQISFAQKSVDISTTKGLNLSRDYYGHLKLKFIPLDSRVVVKTKTKKYKGILSNCEPGLIYVDSIAITTRSIDFISCRPKKRIKNGLGFLISVPAATLACIGSIYLYIGRAGDPFDYIALGSLVYGSAALVTGTILVTNKRFNIDEGWVFTCVE
jgi:hypothetical protein